VTSFFVFQLIRLVLIQFSMLCSCTIGDAQEVNTTG
jgi:hypothetical protein